MIRLMIEDVTLIKNTHILVQVRFKGGAVKSLRIPVPKRAWELRQTSLKVISRIDKLLEDTTESKIACILNAEGSRSGCGKKFSADIVAKIRRAYSLKSRYMRLRDQGLITLRELSEKLNIHQATIKQWARKGILVGYYFNDKQERLYEVPGKQLIDKLKQAGFAGRGKEFIELLSNRIKEVQYAT